VARILLIDDNPDVTDELAEQLRVLEHEVTAFNNAEDGLARLEGGQRYDLVLLDNIMPGGMTGLEFLLALDDRDLKVPVILMTGSPNADTTIQATKRRAFGPGAFGYLIKGDEPEAFLAALDAEIRRVLTVTRPVPRVPIAPEDTAGGLIGYSRAMQRVFEQIGLLVAKQAAHIPVLILGETGTGKDLVANAIHSNSPRADWPFVAINCAALPEALLESELFGHEKGAYTGADRMRKGYFEHADGGTLFLDEVGDMPQALQSKLLRVLQNREITRMGSCKTIEVDVRVLAATSRDLRELVDSGSFRMDLAQRLDGMTLRLPPLRERDGDIERLARYFLRQECDAPPTLHPDAVRILRADLWPGNVRQLENVVKRALLAVSARGGNEIVAEDLDFGAFAGAGPGSGAGRGLPENLLGGAATDTPAGEELTEEAVRATLRRAVAWAWQTGRNDLLPLLQSWLEEELLRQAQASGISKVKQAERLGVARVTLYARLKELSSELSNG
jgi:DNA-binding NtrC family response regulator